MDWNGMGMVYPFVVAVPRVQAAVAAGAYGNNHFARAMLAACDFVGKLRLMIMFSELYNIYMRVQVPKSGPFEVLKVMSLFLRDLAGGCAKFN